MNADQTDCTPPIPTPACAIGEFFYADQGKCVACTMELMIAGKCKCGKGEEASFSPCRACPMNRYKPEGEVYCIDCAFPMVVTDTRSKCVYCEPSFYRQEYETSSAECLKCPEGLYSGLQDTGCHACPGGTTVNADKTGCTTGPTP